MKGLFLNDLKIRLFDNILMCMLFVYIQFTTVARKIIAGIMFHNYFFTLRFRMFLYYFAISVEATVLTVHKKKFDNSKSKFCL